MRIASKDVLTAFYESWRYHHPLTPLQLTYADALAMVSGIGIYHGGDRLYELDGIPGIWHEVCLLRVEGGAVDPTAALFFDIRKDPLRWLWGHWQEALRKLLVVYAVIAAIMLVCAMAMVCWYCARG